MTHTWFYDSSNSDGEVSYIDSQRLGLTVMLDSPHDSGRLNIYIYPLWVVDQPLATLNVDPVPSTVLPGEISIEEPIFTDNGSRAHFPLLSNVLEKEDRGVHGILKLLVNTTPEGLIFDLYDDEEVYWTAAIPYNDLTTPEPEDEDTADRPMLSDDYVETGGLSCPVCRSWSLEGGPVDIESGSAFQEVSCRDCHATWTDFYHLAGYQHLVKDRKGGVVQ